MEHLGIVCEILLCVSFHTWLMSVNVREAEALAMSFGPAIQLCVVFWGPKEQAGPELGITP